MNLKRKDYMKQHSFTDFVYEVIGELRQENRFATAYIYHYALWQNILGRTEPKKLV